MDFMQHSCMLAEPSPVINNSRKDAIVIHQSKIIIIINRDLICASRFGRGVCAGMKGVIQVCVFVFRVSQDISNSCGIRASLNSIYVVLVTSFGVTESKHRSHLNDIVTLDSLFV